MTWVDTSGDWQGLAECTQVPRYEAIAKLITSRCAPGSTVLDIGCGEAILASHLPEMRYFGIEPSKLAWERACERAPGRITHATAENFTATRTFDCIVFNEVLYYARDPMKLLTKYSALLQTDGLMVVSIFEKPESLKTSVKNLLTRTSGNLKCLRIVDRFAGSSYQIEHERIAIPETNLHWRVSALHH